MVSARPKRLCGIKSQVQLEWAELDWRPVHPGLHVCPWQTVMGTSRGLTTMMHSGTCHIKHGCSVLWRWGGQSIDQNRNFQRPASANPAGGQHLSNPIQVTAGIKYPTMCGHHNTCYRGQCHPSHLAELRGYNGFPWIPVPAPLPWVCKELKSCPARPKEICIFWELAAGPVIPNM